MHKKTRGLNAQNSTGNKKSAAPFSEQDPKRRLGDFTAAGEHARQGSRNKGIVGHHKHNVK